MIPEGEKIKRVLALMDTHQVSGPTRGLFQLIEGIDDPKFQIVPGMFLLRGDKSSPATEEAQRRNIPIGLLHQRNRFDTSLVSQAVHLVREHHISIIQSHSYKPAFISWRLKARTGLPWLAFAHGYTSGNASLAVYNILDRWLMRRADKIIAVSYALRDYLLSSGVSPDRISVIHNCINPDDYVTDAGGEEFRNANKVDPKELLVGVIGRFSKEKGQPVFIEAFQHVIRSIPKARGVLIGEGPDASKLKTLVKSLGMDNAILFVGYQNNISSVYGALDLVVIPSFSEGLPNVLLESLLHRKAVVTTAVGGIPEIADASWGKWLVPPRDPMALSHAIVKALTNQNLRQECGVKGERFVRDNFHPTKRVSRLLEIYEALVERSSRCRNNHFISMAP